VTVWLTGALVRPASLRRGRTDVVEFSVAGTARAPGKTGDEDDAPLRDQPFYQVCRCLDAQAELMLAAAPGSVISLEGYAWSDWPGTPDRPETGSKVHLRVTHLSAAPPVPADLTPDRSGGQRLTWGANTAWVDGLISAAPRMTTPGDGAPLTHLEIGTAEEGGPFRLVAPGSAAYVTAHLQPGERLTAPARLLWQARGEPHLHLTSPLLRERLT